MHEITVEHNDMVRMILMILNVTRLLLTALFFIFFLPLSSNMHYSNIKSVKLKMTLAMHLLKLVSFCMYTSII